MKFFILFIVCFGTISIATVPDQSYGSTNWGNIKTIYVRKYTTGFETKEIQFDVSKMVLELRKYLIYIRFIPSDDDKNMWRLVNMQENFTDVYENVLKNRPNRAAMVGDIEKFMPVSYLIQNTDPPNSVSLTNLNEKVTDFVGVETENFVNGNLNCKVSRNKNVSPGKFDLVTLTDVTRTNSSAVNTLENVVVCENDTAIEIQIRSDIFPFGFSVMPKKGAYIVNDLYVMEGNGVLSRYEKNDRSINIVGHTTEVSKEDKYNYERITLRAWKVSSYKKDGQVYRSKRNAQSNVHLHDGAISPGKTKPGDSTGITHGHISDVVENRDDLIGVIVIHFFIFNSREDAKSVFRMSKIWE